jgi:hypothetical protein
MLIVILVSEFVKFPQHKGFSGSEKNSLINGIVGKLETHVLYLELI